jgi:DNA-binding NarL/FixJ family response regulator
MPATRLPDLLLVEPQTLLRRTIALTVNSAHLATMHEASTTEAARSLLVRRRFDGAVIAVDVDAPQEEGGPLALLELIRGARSVSDGAVPVAVMLERCDTSMLAALRDFGVSRIIIKPFRARAVIDAIADLGKAVRLGTPPAAPA